MITVRDYFNGKPHPPEHEEWATAMLAKVNAMLAYLGWMMLIDPDTKCCIAGDAKKGNGDGGYRGPDEPGAVKSLHKTGHAVDVYDPANRLDALITDEILKDFGLWREHPSATPRWVHLQDLPPKSGNRSYMP